MINPRNTIAAIVIAAAVALPATAATTSNTQAVEVKIAGYDLNTEAGAEMVFNRIQFAAERVCDLKTARQSLASKAEAETCEAKAIKRAVASLNSPTLNKVHAQRS